MQPNLTPSRSPFSIRKPAKFLAAKDVTRAEFDVPSPFPRSSRSRGAKRAGILYEQRVHAMLGEEYGAYYHPSVWIRFETRAQAGYRYCQPDGLLYGQAKHIVNIIEVKLKHTADAWFQLRELYAPVVARCFPGARIRVIEVCKWFDPSTPFPEPVHMVRHLRDVDDERFNVYIWNPKFSK